MITGLESPADSGMGESRKRLFFFVISEKLHKLKRWFIMSFERETFRRMLAVNEELSKDIKWLDEQWDDLNADIQQEQLLSLGRRIRLLARLLRNIRENGPGTA